MLLLLLLIPWILTVAALLFIIVKEKNKNGDNVLMPTDDNHEIIKVAVYEDMAYWVHDNIFYQAEVTKEPDFSTAKPIDTMSLSPRQLNELLVILDELQENGKE